MSSQQCLFRPAGKGEAEVLDLLPASLSSQLGFIFGRGTCEKAKKVNQEDNVLKAANLNIGAFGRARPECIALENELKAFAESEPDCFYDEVCLPLVEKARVFVADNLFKRPSEEVMFTPNCTMGMKSIMEALINNNNENFAYLSPLYGATSELLLYLEKNNSISVDEVALPLFEERASQFVKALDVAFLKKRFTVLVLDHVSSSSARIAPLQEISDWCAEKNVVLVVDGTQNFNCFDTAARLCDYYVMSTHKWLQNTKTCGVIVYKKTVKTPKAVAVSFGYNNTLTDSLAQELAKRNWIGMSSVYFPYITLALAVKIFTEKVIQSGSDNLRKGLYTTLNSRPMLGYENDEVRTMNLIKVSPSQFAFLIKDKDNSEDVQPAILQEFLQRSCGVFVSVKKLEGQLYLRISPNPHLSFEALRHELQCLANVLDHTTSFQQALSLTHSKKNMIREQFMFMWDLTEREFSTLKTRAFFIRAERLRHHLIFYYGHVSVFYINKLITAGFLTESDRINPAFESMFAVGVDEMSWDDLFEDNYPWPIWRPQNAKVDADGVLRDPDGRTDEEILEKQEDFVQKVCEYRLKVRDCILQMIDDKVQMKNDVALEQFMKQDLDPSIQEVLKDSFWWIILMGCEHEKIHVETTTVILNQVPLEYLKGNRRWNYDTCTAYERTSPAYVNIENPLINVPGGEVRLGRNSNIEFNRGKDYYGWDNEFGEERFTLSSFKCSQKLVSNAEFLKFVEGGGYQNRDFWCDEGWGYVQSFDVNAPRFWIEKNKKLRWMLEDIDMPWDWPVCVNNLEAAAFVRWKGKQLNLKLRLLSHEEQMLVEKSVNTAEGECENWDGNAPSSRKYNINLSMYGSPTPVDLCFGKTKNGDKIYDPIGNVWRHSCSVLTVLPGFKTHPSYDDFTLPTIDAQHNHILGGSFISMGNCATQESRYGFRRHFYQYAGIRYVESTEVNDAAYHATVPVIYDAVTLGKFCSENYWSYWRSGPWRSISEAPRADGNNDANRRRASTEEGPGSMDSDEQSSTKGKNTDVADVSTTQPGRLDTEITSDTGLNNRRSDDETGAIAETYRHDATLKQLLTNNLSHADLNPVKCWPALFGINAGEVIAANDANAGEVEKILVAYGGVGRATFEMLGELMNTNPNRKFQIHHTDPTANKLQVLENLLSTGRIQWQQVMEGEITELREYQVEDKTYKKIKTQDRAQVSFIQNHTSYANLRSSLHGPYDFVVADFRGPVASNDAELKSLVEVLKPGSGIMLLASLVTPPNYAESVLENSWLKQNCELLHTIGTFPHIFKETKNKHQYQISQLSVWKRRVDAIKIDDDLEKQKSESLKVNHSQETSAYYEDQKILTAYRRFHFDDTPILGNVENVSLAMAKHIDELCTKYNIARDFAMDAGCGPGRVALELAKRGFKVVEATDYGQSFVDMLLENVKLLPAGAGEVIGYQGDAHKIDEIAQNKKFDVVFCCNLIDRLVDPVQYLEGAAKLVKEKNGLIIISSPYTWKVEHTPTEKWIGGKFVDGEKFSTEDALQKFYCTGKGMKFLGAKKIPFAIADVDCTYQLTCSNCTAFLTQ